MHSRCGRNFRTRRAEEQLEPNWEYVALAGALVSGNPDRFYPRRSPPTFLVKSSLASRRNAAACPRTSRVSMETSALFVRAGPLGRATQIRDETHVPRPPVPRF